MIKTLVRRHRLVAVPLLFAMGGMVLPWPQFGTSSPAAQPPAQVIVKDATSTEHGVHLAWLEGQPGQRPVTGYVIERSRANSNFVYVARVEKVSLKYLDTEGQPGDAYRVFAEDDQKPSGRSVASLPLVAAAAKPGSAVVTIAPPLPAIDLGSTPAAKASTLQKSITQAFANFDAALNGHDMQAAKTQLAFLQSHLQQTLTLLPQLSPAQKTPLIDVCRHNIGVFEANAHSLTEQDHMDGVLVIAGCEAIEDGA